MDSGFGVSSSPCSTSESSTSYNVTGITLLNTIMKQGSCIPTAAGIVNQTIDEL